LVRLPGEATSVLAELGVAMAPTRAQQDETLTSGFLSAPREQRK
jgi:hypothetical protein